MPKSLWQRQSQLRVDSMDRFCLAECLQTDCLRTDTLSKTFSVQSSIGMPCGCRCLILNCCHVVFFVNHIAYFDEGLQVYPASTGLLLDS